MDLFDDFEMKPLTEGLGFHKKAIKVKSEKNQSGHHMGVRVDSAHTDSMDTQIDRKFAAMDDLLDRMNGKSPDRPQANAIAQPQISNLKFHEPLPRSESDLPRNATMEIERSGERDFNLPTDNFDRSPNPGGSSLFKDTYGTPRVAPEVATKRGAADSPMPRLKAAPMSFASALLDSVVSLSLALIFLISLVTITKTNILNVLGSAQNEISAQLSLLVLFLAVYQMYSIVGRSFFGKTLGEWTFDLQMGSDDQIKKVYYPILVTWRSLVVVLTGVIVLPLLSFIFRKDLISYVTGIQLYRTDA